MAIEVIPAGNWHKELKIDTDDVKRLADAMGWSLDEARFMHLIATGQIKGDVIEGVDWYGEPIGDMDVKSGHQKDIGRFVTR